MPDLIPAGATVELPYHFNQNGEPIKVQISQDTTQGELQSFLNERFPRDASAVARQMVSAGAPPVTPDEFKEVKDLGDAKETIAKDRQGTGEVMPFLARLGDVGKHVIKDVVDGAAEVATQSMAGTHEFAQGKYIEGLKQSAYGLAKLVEGTMRGGEKMADLAKMATSFLYTGDETSANGYDTYLQLKQNEANDIARASGQTILMGQNKEVADSSNKISNVLDPTIVLPLVGKVIGGVGKAGEIAAADAIKQMAQESSASYLRQFAGNTLEKAGEITSKVGSYGNPLSTGVKTALRFGAGGLAAYEADQGNFGLAAGLGLLAGGPFALRLAGTMAQGAGKTLALDSATLAGREILEQSGKAAAEDAAIRIAMAIKPPDSVVRFVGSAIDSALNGAAIGAGGSYVEAMANPFNSGADVAQAMALGAYGGAGTGLTFHTLHGGGMSEFSKSARDNNYQRNIAHDIMSRPEERSIIVDNKEINVNDRENRINLLVNSDISTGDKARISSVLRSAEASGHSVIFVNDSTILPDALGGTGASMGKGVSIKLDGDGRSNIIINSDRITAAAAVEEVSHALIGDQVAKNVLTQISKEKGGLKQALDSLAPFAETYAAVQAESNPIAAKAFKDQLDIARDPNLPEDARIKAALPLVHEYVAMGAGEMLKGKAPTELETGLSGNIWQKASETVLSGINMTPSGATSDPITGFFWKDGKAINDSVVENITKNVQQSINTGKNVKAPAKTPTDKRVAPPVPEATVQSTGYQAGDITLDGSKIAGFDVGPRYEDVVVDPKTGNLKSTTGAEKDAIHKFVFDQVSKIKGNQIVEQGKWEQGVYAGPIKPAKSGAPDKSILYTDSSLSQPELLKLFSITDHRGNLVVSPEKRPAVELANASISTGNILNLDVNVNLNKSKESNREYAARTNKKVLVLGMQQTPASGPLFVTYDLSLLDNILNHERQLTPKVDAALKDFGITNLQDAVPYIKTYLENLSNSKSLPSAQRLALMAPTAKPENAAILRDVFHLAGGLSQRKGTSEKLTNQPYTEAITKLPPYSVDAGGVKKTLARDQSVFNWHRLDDINEASLYQPNGTPVSIAVNKANMVSRYRANFSPDTTIRENLGESKVITDPESNQRIIVKPSGRADLFDQTGRKITYGSEQEAVNASNAKLLKEKIQFSPGGQRLTPRERKQVQEHLMYSDIRKGTAFQELRAAHDAILRGRQERSGGDLPSWVEAKELRSDIDRKAQSLMRQRRRFAQQIREEAEAYRAEDKPPVFDPESFSPKTGKKARQERTQMSQSEIEAVTEAAGFVAPKGKEAEVRPKATVAQGATLKSLQDLVGLKTFAPAIPEPKSTVVAAQPGTTRPQAVDLISQKTKSVRAVPINSNQMQGFLKELAGSKADLYESALKQAAAKQPSTYIEPPKKAQTKAEPPKETKVEGVVTAVDDPQIPNTHVIQIMPSGNFKVWSIGRQAVDAVTSSYDDALLRAKKRAIEKSSKPQKRATRIVEINPYAS